MKNTTPVKLRSAEISLVDTDIVKVITAGNYESTVQDVDEINETVKELVGDSRHYILVITQQGSTSSSEAKTHAAQESFRKNVIAQAIVISNVAIRLMATAYMKAYRPKHVIKLFNSEEKAMRWLRLLKAREK